MTTIHREYNFKEFFAIDTWPVPGSKKMLVITDPTLAAQVTQTSSLAKTLALQKYLSHLIGGHSLITLEGAKWKAARQLYNPGFALSHLLTLVDGMVDDVLVFCDLLSNHAREGKLFSLEEAATRLTFDVIGRVTLDLRLNSQETDNDLISAFRASLSWTPESGLKEFLSDINPFRPFAVRYYTRKMNTYIGKVLDERLAAGKDSSIPNGRKSVIDRALEEFYAQNEAEATQADIAAFKRSAIDSLKTFMFAGHDTTSSTICYVYLLLFQHPKALARTMAEHAEVFGIDLAAVPQKIKEDPHLLNRLPFTLAVIKETLRLFPAGSTARMGDSRTPLRLPDGTVVSTDGYMVWVVSHTIGRRADLFPSPDSFIPERLLPTDAYPPPSERVQESIPKDAFRPFERGPRNCIGQELSLLETKLIMVLTLRQLDIRPAYDRLDQGEKIEGLNPLYNAAVGGVNTFLGERAYQMLVATAKPVDGFPATVRIRA